MCCISECNSLPGSFINLTVSKDSVRLFLIHTVFEDVHVYNVLAHSVLYIFLSLIRSLYVQQSAAVSL